MNRLLLTFVTGLLLPTGCSGSKSKSLEGVESIRCEGHHLWDAYAPGLQDWQALSDPTDIQIGPYGELIVSDSDNSRIVRFTTNGELLEVIGRRGEGPGEFQRPTYLGLVPDTNVLVVADSGRRISRFALEANQSQFTDSFQSSDRLMRSFWSMAVQDAHSIWINSPTYLSRDSRDGKRVQLLKDDGTITTTFGELWDPNNKKVGTVTRENQGRLAVVGEDLVFLWNDRPRIERISTTGVLLAEWIFDLPEFEAERNRGLPPGMKNVQGIEWIKNYGRGLAFEPISSSIFVLAPPYSKRQWAIYQLSASTLQPIRRFFFHVRGTPVGLEQLAVENQDGKIRLFSIDTESASIFVVSPVTEPERD